MTQPIGVLALQGAFREHVALLAAMGVDAVEVRTAPGLAAVSGLVIPGGESTSIRKLLAWSGLYEPLRERLEDGMPALGTCAGMIVLGRCAPDGAPDPYGLLDIELGRNGFGRQVHSFEAAIDFADGSRSEGIFIRAPRILAVGEGVEILARLDDSEPVAVRQGALLACSFHPELAGVGELHSMLAEQCGYSPSNHVMVRTMFE